MVFQLERSQHTPTNISKVAEKFHLTHREQETLELLVEGMTSKEIGERMKVSPHTVKAFLRLIMAKMGCATRSGVIGKLFNG